MEVSKWFGGPFANKNVIAALWFGLEGSLGDDHSAQREVLEFGDYCGQNGRGHSQAGVAACHRPPLLLEPPDDPGTRSNLGRLLPCLQRNRLVCV